MKIIFSKFINKEKPVLFAVICLIIAVIFFSTKAIYLRVKGETKKTSPVIVQIDNERKILTSVFDEADKILEENNIKVWPEDIVETSLSLDPVTEGGVGQKIVIKRAPVFLINVDDGQITVRSWGKTNKEVLEGHVQLGVKDIVAPELDSTAVPGEINITRINVVDTEELVAVPYETNEQNDFFTPSGVSKVTQAGINGQKRRYLKITYKNGVEVQRVVTGSELVTAPTTKVVKVGLMPSADRDFKRSYWDLMVAAGTKYGISPLDLFEVASCESHLNPNSAGSYLGMYQYTSSFWTQASTAAGFGGALWNDAKAQIYTTAYWASKYGWGRWGCKP